MTTFAAEKILVLAYTAKIAPQLLPLLSPLAQFVPVPAVPRSDENPKFVIVLYGLITELPGYNLGNTLPVVIHPAVVSVV